ncbi:MAG: 50S ribosomal protein L31 [Elusimicrobia bacterium RIFCSPLOWO2_01_FULL_64_13]|nr:MAG: 50S ribosomal protein L31 [Elusimicrobia bacterium RIFCSPHIGHO2_01_FULL_64_10]OGR96473.1 MAG: 50S ribosomal protein L31 [Elusimicrobia bacterium RIFCSPLOWO2_01_FULL_64_13]
MKDGIHPKYVPSTVKCACGHTFQTRSIRPSIHLEICSNCHPFFTGKQKLVDSAGRVERFSRRFEKTQGSTVRTKAKTRTPKSPTKTARKILSTVARKAKAEKKTSDEKRA